jgi:hypothetical protein
MSSVFLFIKPLFLGSNTADPETLERVIIEFYMVGEQFLMRSVVWRPGPGVQCLRARGEA